MLASRDLRSGPGHALTALWCSVATAVWTATSAHTVAVSPSCVKIAVESEQTREREACLGFDRRRQPIQWRRSAWSTRTLSWLLLCEPPSKERFGVVDAAPTPTPTPLLDAIRARAEICVLRTTLSAEMACGVCAANVRCLELDRVCMRIDLVSC